MIFTLLQILTVIINLFFQKIYKFRKNEFTNLELTILDENIEKGTIQHRLKKRHKNKLITLYEKFIGPLF